MNFEYSEKVNELVARLTRFMDEHVYGAEHEFHQFQSRQQDRFVTVPVIERLKEKAREAGLWNLFLADFEDYGYGLSNLEYAPLAEIMGRVWWAPEVFNCNAPDTGNMEVLARFGTGQQKDRWLKPLLNGEIRSAFAMTEPQVASCDATNIQAEIRREGGEYVVNGRKWFITGAGNPRCEIMIFMGKTDPDNSNRHVQQSQLLVPINTPGVKIIRPLTVYGFDEAPIGHMDMEFNDVRVPVENIIGGEGDGFAIAQARLGPGRIHHCMRLIGCAQRAVEIMCKRVEDRVAFGKKLGEQGSIREDIAKSVCEIEQARLLTLKAADKMDTSGYKEARDLIAMIKITAPLMAQRVIDRAVQAHGAMGLSQDTFLAEAYSYARYCRLADGPDQVHMAALGKQTIRRYG